MNKQRTRLLLALFALALTAVAVLFVWQGRLSPQLDGASCSSETTPPANSGELNVRRVAAEPVVSKLLVSVRGTSPALAVCRVCASANDGSAIFASRIGEGRFVFEERLQAGLTVFAFAAMGVQTDELSRREVPIMHLSEFVELGVKQSPALELALRPCECLTVNVRGADNQAVTDAVIGVDFGIEIDAMRWLGVLRMAGIDSLNSWLTGMADRSPQIPLLRQGTRLRLSAQSQGRFGATQPFLVTRSETIDIVLAAGTSFVEIEVRDPRDQPVSGLSMAYRIARGKGEASLRTGPALTDSSGKVRISAAERERVLNVWVIADDWYLAEREAEFPIDGAVHQIVVRPAISIKLQIHFADEQQYSGPLGLCSEPRGSFFRNYSAPGVPEPYFGPKDSRPKPDPTGVYEINGVPGDLGLVCVAVPNRAGFASLNATIAPPDLIPNGVYSLVIPRATAKQASAKLVFRGDFKALQDAFVRVSSLKHEYDATQYALRFRQETGLIYPGEYQVVLFGTASAWHSEPITLLAGETRYVDLPIVQPASVTATIQNHTGHPLSGAVLCQHIGHWASFPAHPVDNWIAVADTHGHATLGGCPSGRVELRIEADGYEPEVIVATLLSGALTDIGAIRLQPARGEIRIKVANFELISKLNCHVDLVVAGGRGEGRRGPYELTGSEFVFRGLPVGRTYSLVLMPRVGESWASINSLRPSDGDPALTIVVDAATFKLEN